MEIMQVVLELSPDLILTLNRHVLPVPWVADCITGPCLKAFPTDGFSPLITETNRQSLCSPLTCWMTIMMDS